MQTDNASSVRQLVHVQLTTPISLDPLVYHLAAHTTLKLFGANALALRLPSFLGFLLMQVCLYVFVRRIASEEAAVFALAFPALTLASYFSSEGRPYGLQLGLFALVLVCWQSATRRLGNRTVALTVLTFALALCLNTHYFGVLLLIPLCAAELVRSIERKRLDLPVLVSIAIGMIGILFTLPFMKPAAEFRKNYYNATVFNIGFIPRAYHDFLLHSSKTPGLGSQLVTTSFAVAVLLGVAYLMRKRSIAVPRAEAVFLVLLEALPIFGYLLACVVTHSIEVRFVLGTVVALSALLALALSPALRYRSGVFFLLLFIIIGGRGVHLILKDRKMMRELQSSMVLPAEIRQAVLASPSKLLYIQDVDAFDVATYYERDPDVRSRLTLVYSRDEEIRWHRQDTLSLTALRMGEFTKFRVVPYESLASEPGDHIFVLSGGEMEWVDMSFKAADATVRPLGPAFEGKALTVVFPSTNAAVPTPR